jgi:predicted phosphodiesterase
MSNFVVYLFVFRGEMGNKKSVENPSLKSKIIFETMVMSDLHLEFDNATVPEFPVVAPILILAGDIGRPDIPSLQRFLLAQCERFEHIFYVAGNHCFYEGEYEDRLEQLRQLDNLHPHIHFLQSKSYLLPNKVRILGTTLWSYVPPEKADEIARRLNDYRCIWNVVDTESKTRRRITVEDTNKWHDQQHAWLLEEIKKARENGEHVVIITHHAPSRRDTCSLEDEEAGIEDAFINDHDADCVDPVRLWIYGHTHRSTDLKINSTRIISNQLGYSWENCGFRPNMKINLYDDGTITV